MSKSARKALALISTIAEADRPLRLMQVSAQAELDKSTALRLLHMLEEMSLVHRAPDTKRYDIGPGLVLLASDVLRRVDTRRAMHTTLAYLRDVTDETVSLHVRAGDQRVCIYGVESAQGVRRVVRVGDAIPLAVGRTGRMLLAMLPAGEARELLRPTAPDEAELTQAMTELATIRDDGYLIDASLKAPGVTAACVPVRFGAQLAVMAVSGPSSRWTTERAYGLLPEIIATAHRLEAILADDEGALSLAGH